MARAVVHVPPRARRGEIVEIRTLVGHKMENGFRHTDRGAPIPRDIITRFVCLYNGVEVCSADMYPAIAANPLLSFTTVATESGTLVFTWTGDNGFALTVSAPIVVE